MRKKALLIFSNILLVIFIVGYLLIFALSQIFAGLCGNEVISETYSPNKKLKAVVFRRDCGATTGYSTHVSILNAWDKLSNDEAGNVFGQEDVIPTTITWQSNEALTVTRAVPSISFTREKVRFVLPFFQRVKVTYETLGAD